MRRQVDEAQALLKEATAVNDDACGAMEAMREAALEADAAAAPASTTTSAYLKEQAENMGERECFGAAVDEEGEDIACDAWFYGEDPTVEKAEATVDAARLEALKEEGRAAVAARRRREAEAAEFQERMRRAAEG